MPLLRVGDHSIPYVVRRSDRARRLSVRVDRTGGVTVVSPRLMGRSIVEGFINDSSAWILRKHLAARDHAARFRELAVRPLVAGAPLPYLGRRVTLVLKASCSAGSVELSADRLVVKLTSGAPERGAGAELRRSLLGWYWQEAQRAVSMSVERQAQATALWPAGLRVRDQRSRWGSCGIHGVLNINWRLILAPAAVLDYVVLHELCHLRHRNHSGRFWSLVAEHMPGFDLHRYWLRQNGTGLMTFLASETICGR